MAPHVPTYQFSEVVDVVGCTARQLQHWLQQGAIVPLHQAAGSGDRRLLSVENVLAAAVALEVSRFRVPLPVLARLVGAPLTKARRLQHRWLWLDTNRAYGTSDEGLQPGSGPERPEAGGYIAIDLDPILTRLRAAGVPL